MCYKIKFRYEGICARDYVLQIYFYDKHMLVRLYFISINRYIIDRKYVIKQIIKLEK